MGTKQRAKQRQDVVGTNCLKDAEGKLQTNIAARKKIWKDHMHEIMNVEHPYTSSDKPAVEGPCEEVTVAEVKSALRALANKKAPGPSGITAEVLKAAGDPCIDVLTTICNQILFSGKMPDYWKLSSLIPLYKGKGDPLSTNSYRGIKLLEHSFKLLEKVFESRLRDMITIDRTQYGFMPGRGTVDAVFVASQVCSKKEAPLLDFYRPGEGL